MPHSTLLPPPARQFATLLSSNAGAATGSVTIAGTAASIARRLLMAESCSARPGVLDMSKSQLPSRIK